MMHQLSGALNVAKENKEKGDKETMYQRHRADLSLALSTETMVYY